MSNSAVQEQLGQAISKGVLPASVSASATQVLKRLEQPLRIVLLGLPGSGKTSVLNLLLGEELIPEGQLHLPTVKVEAGTIPQMICTLRDGTKKIIAGTDLGALETLKPAFVTVQADSPALSKINLLEIVAPDAPDQLRKAVAWATKRADVLIWCTTDFTPAEQELWYGVPDHLKDHGLLVLTKTDLLMGQTEINTRLAQMARISGEEFLRILPLSAKSALQARGSDGKINMTAFKASGATGLIAAIKTQIEEAQREAQDSAAQILNRYSDDIELAQTNDASPVAPKVANFPKVVAESEQPRPATPELKRHEPMVSESVVPELKVVSETVFTEPEAFEVESLKDAESPEPELSEPEQTPTIPSESETPEPVSEETMTGEILLPSAEERVLLEEALAVIAVYVSDLTSMLDEPDKWPEDMVLFSCEEAVAMLPGVLGDGSSPVLSRIHSVVIQAQDALMEMKHEAKATQSDDAVALVLQVRREIEALLIEPKD